MHAQLTHKYNKYVVVKKESKWKVRKSYIQYGEMLDVKSGCGNKLQLQCREEGIIISDTLNTYI